jgi:hypothetical protein
MDSTTTQPNRTNSGIAYPTTHWETVVAAAGDDAAQAEAGLARLCEVYHPVIVRYFTLVNKEGPATGEDLAHEFIARWLAQRRLGAFRRIPNVPFRHYLARALARFWADRVAANRAGKRGRGQVPESLERLREDFGLDPADVPLAMEAVLDRVAALALHRRALARLSDQYRTAKQRERLEVLDPFLLFDSPTPSRLDAAGRLGLSANALLQALFRLRNDYYDAFRAEVAETVSREEIDAEMRYLIQLLPSALALAAGTAA